MPKKSDKLSNDLQRLLQAQDFSTMEELESYIKSMQGKPIPEMDNEALSPQELAEDLVFQAYDAYVPSKAQELIDRALDLDPLCIPAYEYMANSYDSIWLAMTMFQKGIEVGHNIFDHEYEEKHRGNYWMIHETRPFMRCLEGYAGCLSSIGHVEPAIEIYEHMIALNENDNQGVRDSLMLLLIMSEQYIKYQKYKDKYKDDVFASAKWNHVLYLYKVKGNHELTRVALHEALKANKYIPRRLMAPQPPDKIPKSYKLKSAAEADVYVHDAYYVWKETDGVLDWLRKNTK
jgi:tetratricopeptide (TPR) repeat protein